MDKKSSYKYLDIVKNYEIVRIFGQIFMTNYLFKKQAWGK